MKKVFFAFVAVTVIALSACNNKPAESTEATAVDTAAAVVEEAAAVVDSTAAAVVDSAAAAAPAH